MQIFDRAHENSQRRTCIMRSASCGHAIIRTSRARGAMQHVSLCTRVVLVYSNSDTELYTKFSNNSTATSRCYMHVMLLECNR
jgi:hypothetical protein